MEAPEITPMQNAVLAYLEGCAKQDRRCPGNVEICNAVGAATDRSVAGFLMALHRKGYIALETRANVGRRSGHERRITLHSTGDVLETPGFEAPARPMMREASGSCFFCGCRIDACGCDGGRR